MSSLDIVALLEKIRDLDKDSAERLLHTNELKHELINRLADSPSSPDQVTDAPDLKVNNKTGNQRVKEAIRRC